MRYTNPGILRSLVMSDNFQCNTLPLCMHKSTVHEWLVQFRCSLCVRQLEEDILGVDQRGHFHTHDSGRIQTWPL